MNLDDWLPALLGTATLLPLVAFALLLTVGPWLGRQGRYAGTVATLALGAGIVLSLIALGGWLAEQGPLPTTHSEHSGAAEEEHHASSGHASDEGHGDAGSHAEPAPPHVAGVWYRLAQFGTLRFEIGYYIDALTLTMFVMVTIVATCIMVYAQGYMHDELHEEYVDPEAETEDGRPVRRPGRYHRFFQFMSLFCFSMLGLIVAGNILQVFIFWELVGVCSYFLIGFYVERESASTAANKAFIVNRVGDFGFLIGLMILWTTLGTFAFADAPGQPGIFSQTLPLTRPDAVAESDPTAESPLGPTLLLVAGLGIFCGCVGKSAQAPLHVWLPDAMEGPTPVSGLVHSATMVAAGVYLTARFYPVFTPGALLVIASVGLITLFFAACMALVAVDIKRVLAYSTISQLGYMMLALGLGGWVAGVMHLITHAFFKSLLFLGAGSVIHAVHTNDLRNMGALREKMPYTAYTMLVGCLAIIGAGVPLLIGLSGFYSKDAILEQALSFWSAGPPQGGLNPVLGGLFFVLASAGAALTACYMFRMWFMAFVGDARDERVDHAHESPPSMTIPLVVLAVFAVVAAWPLDEFTFGVVDGNLGRLIEQARPEGTLATLKSDAPPLVWPDEHLAHDMAANNIKLIAGLVAFITAVAGVATAALFYWTGTFDPAEVESRAKPIHTALSSALYIDALYDVAIVRPTLWLGGFLAWLDKAALDGLIDGAAWLLKQASIWFERLSDRWIVDGAVNGFADLCYRCGVSLRSVQSGRLRQYVVFVVLGLIALFLVATATWSLRGVFVSYK